MAWFLLLKFIKNQNKGIFANESLEYEYKAMIDSHFQGVTYDRFI